MQFSVLTYNLLFNRASKKIEETLKKARPDLVCLQEVNTAEANLARLQAFGYKLADYSNSFIRFGRVFGNATFYNPQAFKFVRSSSFDLPTSFWERILFVIKKGEIPRTVLETEFIYRKNGKKLRLYNIHLSALAMNNIRTQQIRNTFQELDLGSKAPLVVAGDFNFPYKRIKFEKLIEKYHLKEATLNIPHTSKLWKVLPLKLKLDYVLYKNLLLVETQRFDVKHSDHYPLLSIFAPKTRAS